MGDFKIIFYIVVAIAWAVYKNYQKVQANRPKANLPPKSPLETVVSKTEPVELSPKKSLLQERIDFKNKQKAQNEFNVIKKEGKEKPVLYSVKKEEAGSSTTDILIETTSQIKEENNQNKKNKLNEEFKEEDVLDFGKIDIRRAIIYSEILNRPYV